ncbi:biotin--protein ligase [Roseomonas frigidaquae]|uniref:Biotin--protein ligase n=1 Tax=Falsiroseomonas frigidaquae TaxID=487318 RepID=A0ABX1F8A5_9PROT|nr:biotin--protein ligase [Falsiroseomonas frigidaquae]
MKVAIYQDNVSSNGTLYTSLGRLLGKQNVDFVDANEVIGGVLHRDVTILFMPGGASRYKEAKLAGPGNDAIKNYVRGGGSYFGICAGAYMACETTEWARGTEFEIVRSNELEFFPGKAVGPIKDFSQAESYNGSDARIVDLDFGSRKLRALYWGGCRFVARPQAVFETIATFSQLHDNSPAIVSGTYGSGKWLLSSAHVEYDASAIELIRFEVVGNNFKDIAALIGSNNLSLEPFRELVDSLLP